MKISFRITGMTICASNLKLCGPLLHFLRSVSYTHLDVYKRQNEYIPIVEKWNCIKRWDAAPELPGAMQFGKYITGKGIVAVSYTHLDVYKRQLYRYVSYHDSS